ncbi:MAG: hypothetical protein ACI4TT_00695 [Christensenellales bacterium]
MKFLKWVFNLRARHSWDMARYEKGKMSTKIFVIFLLLALAGATLGVEYWCIGLFNTNFLYGMLVLIFLLIPLTATSFEFCGLYSYLGFKMFAWGTIESIAHKIDKKNKDKKSESDVLTNGTSENDVILKAEANESTADIETIENAELNTAKADEPTKQTEQNSQKAHKWVDLLIGILGLVLCVGLVAGMIVLVAV